MGTATHANWGIAWVFPGRLTADGKTIAGYPRIGSRGPVTAAADGGAVIAAGDDMIAVVDREQHRVELPFPTLDIFALALSRMGGTALILAEDRNTHARRLLATPLLSPASTTDLAKILDWHGTDRSVRLTISTDGTLAALSSGRECTVLGISAASVVYRSTAEACSISPDGRKLALLDGGSGIVVITVPSGSRVRWLKGRKVIGIGAWSPDGRYLAAGIFKRLHVYATLVAASIDHEGACAIATLAEGDRGGGSSWIANEFLAADRRPI